MSLLRRSRDPVQQLKLSVFMLVGLLVAGSVGFSQLEGIPLVDGLYMTVITFTTATTAGFRDVPPLSATGRLFSVILIIAGVAVVAWFIRNAAEIALSEELWHTMSKRHMNRVIAGLSQHYIICGCGRMGQAVIAECQREGVPYVVIEERDSLFEELMERDIPFIQGDASSDKVLLQAGIERARGAIAVVDCDADNVMVVITAKALNPQVTVVARSASEESAKKLRLAGADDVLSPYAIGGKRLALSVLRPTVAEFLSHLVYDEGGETELEEVQIELASPWVGHPLSETKMRERWGAIVVGIRKATGEMIFGEAPSYKIAAGDTLVIVVQEVHIPEMRAMAQG